MTTRIITDDCREALAALPDESVHCCVTSPPYYGLRDYGVEGQIGLEATPAEYIEHMVAVFREVRRVLRRDGTLWLNIGDSYCNSDKWGGGKSGNAGKHTVAHLPIDRDELIRRVNVPSWAVRTRRPHIENIKPKDLLGIPWALAFALRDDGWYLRSEITWAKRAPMPESVTDRPTSATEKVFLFAKRARYFYDAEAVKEGCETHPKENYPARAMITGRGKQGFAHARGEDRDKSGGFPINGGTRNMRNFWYLGPEPFPEAHFATFPTEIPRRAILAGTSERGVCPKCGAPWTRSLGERAQAGGRGAGNGFARDHRLSVGGRGDETPWVPKTRELIGWQPACSCGAGTPVPATCLDPFLGAGTTALVADQLGRDCIGIELSPTYAEMARRRIEDDAGMFADLAAE